MKKFLRFVVFVLICLWIWIYSCRKQWQNRQQIATKLLRSLSQHSNNYRNVSRLCLPCSESLSLGTNQGQEIWRRASPLQLLPNRHALWFSPAGSPSHCQVI